MAFSILGIVEPAQVDPNAQQCRVPMRDGVHLATDVFLPAGSGPHPAILARTPYDKASRYTRYAALARHYNRYGYALVVQDSRGRYRSEGETIPYFHDLDDSYDSIEWIIAQPWSSGEVGLIGTSYPGSIVWAGIASGHPAIRAAIAQATATNMPDMHLGGHWKTEVPALFAVDDLLQIWTPRLTHYLAIDYGKHPAEAFEEAISGLGVRSFSLDYLLENSRTGAKVDPYGERHPHKTARVPILHWVEWYDPGLAGPGLADFHYFRSQPETRHLHHLRAASADHSSFRLEDVPCGPHNDPATNDAAYAARCEREALDHIAFFEQHMRGIETGVPPIRWHLGHVGWQSSTEWPPQEAVSRTFYLSPEDRLSSWFEVEESSVTWIHDPEDPVPSLTTPDDMWAILRVYPDERAAAERDDVLCFTTDPLEKALDLAGRVTLTVTTGSTAPSMHLFAKLQDVQPDGTVRTIVRGQRILTAADGKGPVTLELQEVAYRFRAGHSVRLQVASSDHPYYAVHPGTDENPWFAEDYRRAEQHITLGGVDPSRLTLQCLPNDWVADK